jgi:predicted NBD/HSP70 family sugar kinase
MIDNTYSKYYHKSCENMSLLSLSQGIHAMKRTTRDIRRGNRLAVLQHIYASAPISRQELTESSGLSQATVANVVTDLLDIGIVIESGYADSQGGRPPAILGINATNGAFIGVDVAETYIHFELFDLRLVHQSTVEHTLPPEENQPYQIVDHLAHGLQELLRASGTSREKVLGVGISVPGLVERSGGVSVFAPNWAWQDVPLAVLLKERIDLPIYLDNPLKASAVAELWFGAGRGVQNLVTLNLGTGVGAGVIANGALYRGTTNSAGEWGHTTIVLDGRPCRCGSRGCLEAYVGAPGIIQTLRELAPGSPLLHPHDQTAAIAAIAAAARQGDPIATQVIHTTARYLGAGVANIINLFNPEVVVLGSWVGMQLGPALLPELHASVARYALSQPLGAATIQLCQLLHNPISMGAATFALEGFLAAAHTKIARARA